MSDRPVIVVEDDPFPRLLKAFLDGASDPERDAAIADFVAHDLPDYRGWLARLRSRAPRLYPAEVRLASTQDELRTCLRGAFAVVTESLAVGPAELAVADRLKVVQKYGTVLRNVDVDACAAHGIEVLTLRRRANIGTAEHAFALMLALAKKLNEINGLMSVEQLRAAGYKPGPFDRRYTSSSNWARIGGLRTLYGSTLGIVGLGEIGREVALRAAPFGMRVLYHQRSRVPETVERELHVEYRALDALLATSDCVCLLVPSNTSTRHLIDHTRLAQMKRGACLVNVSRAEIVEREALIEALRSGQLGSFGLDTFYEEPARADDPLLGVKNAIITPRTAAQPRFNALGDLEEVIVNLDRTLQDRGLRIHGALDD